MDIDLDLEDLAYPATLRAINEAGEPGGYLRVNQRFLDFYGLTEAPHAPADVVEGSLVGLDEMDRRVAASCEPVTYNLPYRGRTLELLKNPVMRERVVGVLTFLVDADDLTASLMGPSNRGCLTEAIAESFTVFQIEEVGVRIVSQNRASLEFDRLIDSLPDARGRSVRRELLAFASDAAASHVPRVDGLAVGERHFAVHSEVFSDADVGLLLAQTLVDVSDRWRSQWLEQLVGVASTPDVVAAAQQAFAIAEGSLDLERSALLRIDGHMADVFAASAAVGMDRRLHLSEAMLDLVATPGARLLSAGGGVGAQLLESLGAIEGVAIPLQVDGDSWGVLILGATRATGRELTPLTMSMLEALGSTLGMLVERGQAKQRLQESNRRLEEYAHAAAHDLRSPLRRIRSFAQIVQARLGVEEIDREQISDFADRIARGAAQLDTLLESMLEHANISALADESTEYTDLQLLAEHICGGIVELSQDPKPSFHVVGLPEVRLPHDAAERVLRNLIDNSLKYAAKDRAAAVDLRGEPFEGGVRVRVHDNGIGIEPQFADKIFQLFNQLSNDTSGSGVGLAVVERLLSTRGAKIWVESEVGAGATFVIEFPQHVLRARERSADDRERSSEVEAE